MMTTELATELTTINEIADRYTLCIDHQIALRAASKRLNSEFACLFNSETVERFLAGSYEQFAAGARFPNYVHIFAERFARERLFAFARVEGHLSAARPIVLFVCASNDLYSPMARALFEQMAGTSALAWSAGLRPSVALRDGVYAEMKRVGVSMINEYPKPIAPEMFSAATIVVTFGCADECAVRPGCEHYALPAPPIHAAAPGELERLRGWMDDCMKQLHQRLFPGERAPDTVGHLSLTFAP